MESNVIREIKRISEHDSHRFSFIAKYIIKNLTIIPNMNIKELAKATYSSSSTIHRFTQYLKLSGYKELIHVIKYFNFVLVESDEVKRPTGKSNIIHKLYNNSIESLEETFKLFLSYEDTVQQIVHQLKKAQKINIFAVGGTYNLARDFSEKLMRVGLHVTAINNFHTGYFLSKQSNQNVFSIFVSYSGETQDLVKLALICKERKSPILVVSKKSNNLLSKIANFKIGINSNEPITRAVSFTSRMALLFALDLIFYQFLLSDFDYYQTLLQTTSLHKF